MAESLRATPHDKIPRIDPPDRPIPAAFGGAVPRLIEQVQEQLDRSYPRLAWTFARCYGNALATATTALDDGTTFMSAGDIPNMWPRDAVEQVRPYLRLAGGDPALRGVIAGVIRRLLAYILIDPYANAFNMQPDGTHYWPEDRPSPGPWIRERKWALDSFGFTLRLMKDYQEATGDCALYDAAAHEALCVMVKVMETEQDHDHRSSYAFERNDPEHPGDTLPFGGRGTRSNFTGMIWSAFRPSDDPCTFGYHIPSNMLAAVGLGYLAECASAVYGDEDLAGRARRLERDIRFGIETYGVVDHPRCGQIYAYETDGFGHYLLMDDANYPSLLSIPHLGYRPATDGLYRRTRAFALSRYDPYYIEGSQARGMGSAHPYNPAPDRYIWPIGLIMQGLTATSPVEQWGIIEMLAATTAGTGYMHEAFDANDPKQFLRAWCPWSNSLFGELVLRWLAGSGIAG
jgi:uncharacterized protein